MDESPVRRYEASSSASSNSSKRLLSKAPLFNTGYSRSISLPQALHSLTATRSKKRRSDTDNLTPAAGSADEEYIRKVSDPSASSSYYPFETKRPIRPLRPLGRSETTADVSRTLYSDLINEAPLTEERIEVEQLDGCVERLHISPPAVYQPSAAQRALCNPDILYAIFDALDAMSVIPREIVLQRRNPISLRHAQLMFGNDKDAHDAWESSKGSATTEPEGAGLYSCLLVNSTWYSVAVRILEARVYFNSVERFTQFTRRGVQHIVRKPRMLVLHKLTEVTQVELDLIDHRTLGEQLEWLEFYTCSGLAPPPSLLGINLKRVILPGCFRVNDRTLAHIAERCPQLEHLDVRACEQISDRGIKIIAKMCPRLQLLNVGRNRNGELITYKGIKHLARQTQISTLGLAGCYIDDRAIWELALNRGVHIQRLSINNCHLVSDASIPRVLGYMPNLNVLEIRGCTSITHMRPLALFRAYREKQGQTPLFECCEIIERRLQLAIMKVQRETSQRVLDDLTMFINAEDAG